MTDRRTVRSPWTALEYCSDVQDLSNTWVCHAPESCGCDWNVTRDLLVLTPRGCKDMGSDALVALYAPKQLAPYVSLPPKLGGSTGYYSPTVASDGTSSWVETAVPGCKLVLNSSLKALTDHTNRYPDTIYPAHNLPQGANNICMDRSKRNSRPIDLRRSSELHFDPQPLDPDTH
jgi:hypothetical protein